MRSMAKIMPVMMISMMVMTMCFSASPAFAQAEAGSITGAVRDSSGGVVPGATVTAKNTSTSAERTATTGGDGRYVIPGLNPGIYEVAVSVQGFAKFNARVEVTVGASATLDAQLSVSNQVTTVEVVAAGGVEVNTQNQELSQIVTRSS